jgi:hypothetical protein
VREEIARRAPTNEATVLIRETLVTQKGWRDEHLADLDSMQEMLDRLLEATGTQNTKLDELLAESNAVSREMLSRVAKTQTQMVELLTHIVSEVEGLKGAINKGPTS